MWHDEFLVHAQLVVAYHNLHTLMGLPHVRADRTHRAASATTASIR
jgi:hypothetical protein